VPLVLRYDAMKFLGHRTEPGKKISAFGLSDLGARCLAEHVGRAVALSLLRSQSEPALKKKREP